MKVALVTGASAGIGQEIARTLARHHFAVGLIARRADRLADLVSEIAAAGGQALALPADVTDETALRDALDQLIGTYGRLDALINNAGMGFFGQGKPPTVTQFDQVFAVNVRSVYLLSQMALPYLETTSGVIINLGSAAVERPFAGELVYMASKGAVSALTSGMAASWGQRGVRVNLVQPGVIASEFLATAGVPGPVAEQMLRASAQLNALPTVGKASDVAEAVRFLVSEEARFITGATLNVDGGFSLGTVRS